MCSNNNPLRNNNNHSHLECNLIRFGFLLLTCIGFYFLFPQNCTQSYWIQSFFFYFIVSYESSILTLSLLSRCIEKKKKRIKLQFRCVRLCQVAFRIKCKFIMMGPGIMMMIQNEEIHDRVEKKTNYISIVYGYSTVDFYFFLQWTNRTGRNEKCNFSIYVSADVTIFYGLVKNLHVYPFRAHYRSSVSIIFQRN